MGVDLTLLPLMSEDFWCSHDLIRINRRRDLWDAIMALPQKPIPEPLGCYIAKDREGNTCYGDTEETPYGERMQFTTAGDLSGLVNHEDIQDNWQNRAVWAYLAAMPKDWPVVLYWH